MTEKAIKNCIQYFSLLLLRLKKDNLVESFTITVQLPTGIIELEAVHYQKHGTSKIDNH